MHGVENLTFFDLLGKKVKDRGYEVEKNPKPLNFLHLFLHLYFLIAHVSFPSVGPNPHLFSYFLVHTIQCFQSQQHSHFDHLPLFLLSVTELESTVLACPRASLHFFLYDSGS